METETQATQAPPGCSQSIAQLAAALAKAQGTMKAATKDAENPHFRSKYADLASVWEACRGPLSANGLAVLQRVRTSDTSVTVTTMLTHSSGEWVADEATYPLAQRTPQAIGSAITYARRYALSALVGVAADEDDDSNAASERERPQRREPAPRPAPKRPPSPPPAAPAAAMPACQHEWSLEGVCALCGAKEARPTQTPAVRARFRAVYTKALGTGMDGAALQRWVSSVAGRECPSNELTADEVAHLEAALPELLGVQSQEPGSAG